ncbi:MAG: nucleotidyltransferase [Candidatus Sumerlaeota bacterium]|nr:nucleotidyltransferase [Candidatus Sumerlaeota bacterium]
MPVNSDFKEMFSIFNEEKVEYLVVGAHAVIFYSEPRYTKDLDIWVNPTPDNACHVYRALKRFGAPLHDIEASDFVNPKLVFQMGMAPNRFDIIMQIAEVEFSSAWPRRSLSSYGGVPVNILGIEDLIKNKEAAGRSQDKLDVEKLRRKETGTA